VRYRHGNVLLCWIHPLQPAVQQPVGDLCEGLQMKEDDNDFEMFGDLVMLVGCLFFLLLLVIGISALVWWML